MLRNRLLAPFAAVFLFVALLIILPVLFNSTPLCANGIAAQEDDACLAERATNSAMQVEFQQVSFQATLDTINHQATLSAVRSAPELDCPATVAALESELDAALGSDATPSIASLVFTPVPTTSPGIFFTEDFSNNMHGWDLTGGVTITRGELGLYGSGDALVPFETSGDFYLEVDARTTDSYNAPFYIGFGDISGGSWHLVRFRKHEIGLDLMVGEEGETIFSTDHRTSSNTMYRIKIAYRGGQIEIFVDGTPITLAQLTNLGSEFRLGKGGDSTSQEAFFDNLVIQTSR